MIPEINARNILKEYNGFNNVILEWKYKFETQKNFNLTRGQALYVLKNHTVKPKIARKYVTISKGFGEKLMKDYFLDEIPKQIWCEKLLCDSDKAFNFWGKIIENQELHSFWVPKSAIDPPEKKLDYEVNYSPYSHRPPMEHQKVAIEKLLANDRFILADDMGLGKTTSSVIAALESGARKILIVCPASLKINWSREIGNYTDRRVLIVEGRKWGHTFDFYIINYDIIKNFHTTEKSEDSEDYKLLKYANFDLAIVDEAHYISNPSANRTKLLNDILTEIPKVWLLTGTPMTSRPINYYNLLKLVEAPVALNWQTYVRRYCGGYQFTVKGRKIWNTSGATNLDELRDRTKNFVLRRLKTDNIDLPEKIITPIFLELESTFYNEELDEFIKITKEESKKESIAVTLNRLMKVRQVIAQEKIPYTCEIIDRSLEQDKKVIILTNFTMIIDMLKEKYKKKCVVVDGRINKLKRQEAVDKFQNDPKVTVFAGNIKAAGVGLNLTAAEIVIMNDLSFVPSDHAQGEDRAYRMGQKKSVSVYYPIFENTVEMNVYNLLEKKKNVIDQVMGEGEYSENFTKELFKSLF